MRRFLVAVVLLTLLANPLAAADRWILIAGTVANFHTDARVFNPSFEKDIQVTAKFALAGNPPVNNAERIAGPDGATFTVPKRSMLVLNDVTTALFASNALGAILFTSPDPFEVTSRIYAQTANGTLGQFGPGISPGLAFTKGTLLQMKANGSRGNVGTFRTNIGLVNPVNADTTVQLRLYDRNNTVVGTGELTLPAYGVTTPISMGDPFFWDQLTAGDLSDAWVSFSATNPIFAYASVLDNGTEDQTFVPAVQDVGVEPAPPPPQSTTHTFDVTLEDFSITFSPAPTNVKVGDTVILRIRRLEGSHGFQMSSPSFTPVVPSTIPSGSAVVERTFTANAPGNYGYFCTVSSCGEGHSNMFGTMRVEAP